MEPLELRVKHVDGVEGLDEIDHQSEGDAGIDLRASGRWVVGLDDGKKEELVQDKYELQPSERILIKTGVKAEIPSGYWGNIRDRSGLAFKQGLHVLAGVIDERYREEIGVVMVNTSSIPRTLEKNERIAQMIITPYARVDVKYGHDLSETDRGDGFGSSGKK